MALVVEDEIVLSTRLGTCQVQLLLGDITQLPVKDKVDIVFSSAFPGDYGAGNPRTLFHSLKKNLGIIVKDLAKQRDLDLRKNFSCWMSGRLPDDKPFRRLVCFEINHQGQSITEQISMVFRALMPIFNGSESTVITPILATGCQSAPLVSMLAVMVNTACQWIKAGLPLKCLKLVLYTNNPDSSRKIQYKDAIASFAKLKWKWMDKERKMDNVAQQDICFCYAEKDKQWVSRISASLKSLDNGIRIHSAVFKKNEEDSWQDDVYSVMANSVRILVILTPAFVSDIFCLEQFNMAMCCNRLKKEQVVIPLYLETVDAFPSYMNLVQYTECRVRKEGETLENKLLSACTELINNIHAQEVVVTDEGEKEKLPTIGYDIFISYSHRNAEVAKILVDILEKNYPDLKVFFDRSELKSGNIWQQSLYEAVDKSRCMVALLSDTYIKSTVCQEEFYIAAGRQFAKENFLLLSVCLPELTHLPSSFNCCQLVKMPNKDTQKAMEAFTEKLIPVVTELKKAKRRKQSMKLNQVKNILSRQRIDDIVEKFHVDANQEIEKKTPTDISSVEGTVTFSYNHDGLKFAAILSELIKLYAPKVDTKLLSAGITEAKTEIDSSDIVISFVSDGYLESQHHLEELHIALCKQRIVKESTCVYLVEADHTFPKPFYPHILPFQMSLGDTIWQKWGKKRASNVSRFIVRTDGMQGTYMCSAAQHIALKKAMYDVLDLLSARNQGSTLPTNIVNVIKSSMDLKKTPDSLVNIEKVAVRLSSLSLSVELHPVPQQEDVNDENNKEEEKEDAENESPSIEKSEKTFEHHQEAETLMSKPNLDAGKSVIAELKQLAKSGQPVLKDRFKLGESDQDVVNPDLDKAAVNSAGSGQEVVKTTTLNHIDYVVKKHYYKGSLNSAYAGTANEEDVVSDNCNMPGSSDDGMGNSNSDNAQTCANRFETEQDDTNKSQPSGMNGDDLVVHESNLNVNHMENARRQGRLMAEMEKELMSSEKKKSKACIIV